MSEKKAKSTATTAEAENMKEIHFEVNDATNSNKVDTKDIEDMTDMVKQLREKMKSFALENKLDGIEDYLRQRVKTSQKEDPKDRGFNTGKVSRNEIEKWLIQKNPELKPKTRPLKRRSAAIIKQIDEGELDYQMLGEIFALRLINYEEICKQRSGAPSRNPELPDQTSKMSVEIVLSEPSSSTEEENLALMKSNIGKRNREENNPEIQTLLNWHRLEGNSVALKVISMTKPQAIFWAGPGEGISMVHSTTKRWKRKFIHRFSERRLRKAKWNKGDPIFNISLDEEIAKRVIRSVCAGVM